MTTSHFYSRLLAVVVAVCVLMIEVTADSTSSYLYDISTDPTELKSVYNYYEDSTELAAIQERLSYWTTQVADAQVASKTNKVETWYASSGVRPWIDSDYEPFEPEKIYDNADAPNIIFVLVDDWGYNDFGQRSSYLSWTTPNVDSLASEGVLLTNYFTHEVCTPSRGALLTGKYALRLGMMEQHEMPELPLHEITLAQEMKSAGYRTYMVGKWHLGMSTINHWPTRRGFDSFYGFVNGDVDYWTKNYGDHLDLQDNEDLVTDPDEIDTSLHNGYLLQSKAEQAIIDHASNYADVPMFLYYSMQLIHAPWSAPASFIARCESPSNYLTADEEPDDYVGGVELNYCALNLMMDEVIANLTCTLQNYHMRDNTYLIISGDNGGETTIPGNSFPFRGHKGSYWRGGVSNTAMIHSPLLSKSLRGKIYDGYVHITDWLPTLMNIATNGQWTGSLNGTALDGIDQWEAITTLGDSPRSEMVFYAGDDGTAAIQVNDLRYYVTTTGQPDVSTVDYVFAEDSGSSSPSYLCEDVSLLSTSSMASSARSATSALSLSKSKEIPLSFVVGMIVIGTILLILFRCLEMQTASNYEKSEAVAKAEEVPLYYHLEGENDFNK